MTERNVFADGAFDLPVSGGVAGILGSLILMIVSFGLASIFYLIVISILENLFPRSPANEGISIIAMFVGWSFIIVLLVLYWKLLLKGAFFAVILGVLFFYFFPASNKKAVKKNYRNSSGGDSRPIKITTDSDVDVLREDKANKSLQEDVELVLRRVPKPVKYSGIPKYRNEDTGAHEKFIQFKANKSLQENVELVLRRVPKPVKYSGIPKYRNEDKEAHEKFIELQEARHCGNLGTGKWIIGKSGMIGPDGIRYGPSRIQIFQNGYLIDRKVWVRSSEVEES
jgi:hypothetical protein